MIKISVTDSEIQAYIAEAGLRRKSRYPRCDCEGDKKIAKKWKQDARADVCGFIKGQFGRELRDLDVTDKKALLTKCAPYIPEAKLKQLRGSGRRSRTFWVDFCGTPEDSEADIPDSELLGFMKKIYPKYKSAKKLSDIALSANERKMLRSDVVLMSRISLKGRTELGLVRKALLGKPTKDKLLSPGMTVSEAEEFVLRSFKDPSKASRDPNTGKIVIHKFPRQAWLYIAHKYGSKLPQGFLDLYADSLVARKPGRKSKLPVDGPIVSKNKRPKILKKHGKKPIVRVRPSAQEVLDTQRAVNEAELSKPAHVPPKIITAPDRLNSFINNLMRKHDDTYPLSTPIQRWSNPEWSMVDVHRDSVSPELLTQYSAQINQARNVLNVKSGGAYASIRNTRQLAVAHIVTAWLCGDL